MFSEEEIQLVRATWEKVSKEPETAAALFYGKLFETAPAVRPLFKGDMVEQGKKLMQMLAIAVNNMDRLEEIAPALADLGTRHEAYGALPAHYPVVGGTLLDTLEAALGDEFTPPTRAAWSKTYGAVVTAMKIED